MTSQEFEQLGKSIASLSFTRKNYTASKAEGLRYIKYRLLRPFLKLSYNAYQRKNPEAPWISASSTFALKKILTKEMVGFEFGSGRSTIFYAFLLKHVTSIEHFEPWFQKVEVKLKEKEIQNATLKLVRPNGDAPSQHLSSEQQLFISIENYPVKDVVFHNYINTLDAFPDAHFDFIAVDGRARLSCVHKSINKLKSRGILLLDNSERRRYKQAIDTLKGWPKIYTTTGLTDTTIWMKP